MEAKGYSREDWQKHYDDNDLGWDLGQVAPPFVNLLESKTIIPGKTLVPGCGRGHEVIFLAENGFDVTAVDYSTGAVNHLNSVIQERKLNSQVLHLDFFTLDSTHDGLSIRLGMISSNIFQIRLKYVSWLRLRILLNKEKIKNG